MNIDTSNIKNDSIIETDICVVGAGAAGITFAREFIGTDSHMVLLESGGKEFDENAKVQDLNQGKNEPLNEEIEDGIPHYNLKDIRARAFGGSSHLWHIPIPVNQEGLRLRGLDNIDFEKRDWVPNSGWPIGKEDLDKYFEQAHKVFKIGPYKYDANSWLSKNGREVETIETENLKTTVFQFARKDIFYKDYWEELEKAENVDVYLHSTVLRVQLHQDAKSVKSVLVSKPDGTKYSVKAKHYILAIGGLEAPRLLLLSKDVMRSGVGNQNDLVGRFFMEHPHLETGMFYPSDKTFFEKAGFYNVHQKNGVAIQGKITATEKIIKEEKLLNFTLALIHIPMVGLVESEMISRNLFAAIKKIDLSGIGNSLKQMFKNAGLVSYILARKILRGDKEKWYGKKYKYHGFRLGFMTEQIPDPESRVLIDHDSIDEFGQEKIKLNWKINKEDVRNLRRTQDVIDRELRKNKLGRIEDKINEEIIPKKVHGGKHHMGTTRMSTDPMEGVVDRNCQIHGVNNLFIAGSSVFPTGGYSNPTLTIVALSLRLADHIKKLSN